MKIRFFGIVLIITVLIFGFHWLYFLFKDVGALKIEAHFDTLRPFSGHADVFFRGYKVGRSRAIRPADDYKHSIVDISLYPRDLILPKNIKVQLRKKTIFFKFHHDYFEIIYPDVPDKELLAGGDCVVGLNTVDVKDYLASQDSDSLDEIRDNLNNAAKSLDKMLLTLSDLFASVDNTVRNSQKSIQNTTKNVEEISKNIAQISDKLNRAATFERVDRGASDIGAIIDYVKESAKNIEDMTKNLDVLINSLSQQSGEISSVIKNTNSILGNANELTAGLNNTLSKQFGVFRLLFGRALSK